jgi:dephospho-CoA kinase
MSFILGLTGSIGMGKSTTAGFFRALGVPVHDADRAVHELYRGAAVTAIDTAFPGTSEDGVINRKMLADRVFSDPSALKRLESIIHPLVREAEKAFLTKAKAQGTPLVVLDVPLLFETDGQNRCDAVIVVTASADLQKQRVLSRPGMSEERFNAIVSKQMPDAEKRRRAHVVIDTGSGIEAAARDVAAIVRMCAGRPGRLMMRGTGG